MNFLDLHALPIFEQLQMEEALLRTNDENWCIINTYSPPAIVMGISAQKEKVLNVPLVEQDKVMVIKRFSGGGTVYVDEQTIFVTFLLNFADFALSPFPNALLNFSARSLSPYFAPHPFTLRENDFVMGERKIGGNAEYIRKNRGLVHTSFLWRFSSAKMEYLQLPEKRPAYRENRPHAAFLTSLEEYYPNKDQWLEGLKKHLFGHFTLKPCSLAETLEKTKTPHRQATERL